MALLDPADVRAFLPQHNLPAEQIDVADRIVAGWLRRDSGRAELPVPLPDEDPLWPAAIELVALLASNPELLAAKTVGPTSRTWPLAQRRDAIRQEVRSDARRATSGPRGTFPAAEPWPDPVLVNRRARP